MRPNTLTPELLQKMDAYWRAANYLSVLNDLDRFHLGMDAIDRLPQTGDQGIYLKQQLKDLIVRKALTLLLHQFDNSPGTKPKDRREYAKDLQEIIPMKHAFKVGDHVEWNSEAGHVRGIIKKKVTSVTKFKTYTVRATVEEPQYLIKSDKTDHMAMHKGAALKKLDRRDQASPNRVAHPKSK